MKHITYSAPAKVILSGEHAVVYGKPALVSAIDLRLRFKIWEDNKNIRDKTISLISEKVKRYLQKQKIACDDKKFNFGIKSEIPLRYGLGSSAALSVASVATFLKFYSGKDFEKEAINNLAYQVEKIFHNNPSGVDVSTSCYSGLIYYRKEFEFLKNISCLNFKIPKKIEEKLYLIDTGRSLESTAELVNLVGINYNKKARFIEEVFNGVEKTTKRMVVSLIKKDKKFFQQCIFDNEIYLEMLGVVSDKTEMLLKKLSKYGVGKVTGAGGKKEGSGFLLFYANEKKELEKYCKKQRIPYFQFKQSYEGLKKEL